MLCWFCFLLILHATPCTGGKLKRSKNSFSFSPFSTEKKTILKTQIVKKFCLLLELKNLIDQNIFQSSKKIQKI
jgi:hypothetical protein